MIECRIVVPSETTDRTEPSPFTSPGRPKGAEENPGVVLNSFICTFKWHEVSNLWPSRFLWIIVWTILILFNKYYNSTGKYATENSPLRRQNLLSFPEGDKRFVALCLTKAATREKSAALNPDQRRRRKIFVATSNQRCEAKLPLT